MAENKKDDQDDAQNELLASLGKIYSFIRSREYTKSVSNFSFDDYIDQAKNQIKSDEKGNRRTKSQKLDQLEEEISNTIERAKQLRDDNKEESQK